MGKESWAVKIWSEGKCLDLWSVNHFLGGFLLGYVFVYLGFCFWIVFLGTLLFMSAWEIFEMTEGVEEYICNKLFDVVTGLAGLLVFYVLILNIDSYSLFLLFIFSSTIFIALEVWGYLAYRIRTVMME
ncbi:hypothetical protein KKC65_02365 [Patescibacteria group bacterium]|nr:hypothetical protein [Patescibacteria group bacterium]